MTTSTTYRGRRSITATNTLAGGAFAAIMSVRVASALEAQYIVAEAQGPTAATLAFVNLRRAAGLQTPVTLAGDASFGDVGHCYCVKSLWRSRPASGLLSDAR